MTDIRHMPGHDRVEGWCVLVRRGQGAALHHYLFEGELLCKKHQAILNRYAKRSEGKASWEVDRPEKWGLFVYFRRVHLAPDAHACAHCQRGLATITAMRKEGRIE